MKWWVAGLLACLLVGGSSAFLDGYGYYQDVTINNTGSNLTNYQMMFTVNTPSGTSTGTTIYLNSHSEADLDDLRFTSTSDTMYDYWIEENTNTTTQYNVFVEIPSIPTGNTTMRVQYGNVSAAGVSNGPNTFMFFDTFDGAAINGSAWDGITSAGSYSVSGGMLTLSGGSVGTAGKNGIQTKSTITFTPGFVLQARVNRTLGAGSWAWRTLGTTSLAYNTGRYPWDASCWFVGAQADTATGYLHNRNGAAETGVNLAGMTSKTWCVETIKAAPSNAWSKHYVNSSSEITNSNNMPSGAMMIVTMVGNGATANDAFFDWVLVRQYTATEPTGTAWSGEGSTCVGVVTPVAAFSTNVTSGFAPLYVGFTDSSTNTPTSWAWSFDDGGANSTDQNPNRTFNSADTYTITLTSSNCAGSDIEQKIDYITVYELQKFPGCSDYPTDLDADGLYEDINGNGRKDWSDNILFLNNCDWAKTNEPPAAFDWNGNAAIDFGDVVMLWQEGV